MYPNAMCTFHGIGQGLFYSGTIYNEFPFVFVYDCGTTRKSHQELLKKEIDELFGCGHIEKQKLDALFISHFDLDHISGVPYLLNKCHVKNVFIPYFTPEVMKLLALRNAGAMSDGDLRMLYEDPVTFFLNHGCEQVVVLYPSTGEIQNGIQNEMLYSPDGNFTYRGDISQESSRLYNCYGQGQFHFNRCDWDFQIYQDQSLQEQDALRKKIQTLIPSNTPLSSLLTDEELKKEVRALYNSVKHGINQSSMVLYHAPSNPEMRPVHIPFNELVNHCGVYHEGDSGTLLTGDLNLQKLRQRGNPFKEFVSKRPHKIGIFQLPHHGSGKSISVSRICEVIPFGKTILACSYGLNNRYGHPHAYSLNEAMQRCGSPIIHVVEKQDFTYTIDTN